MLHWCFSESRTNPRLDASSQMTVLVLPDRNPLHVAVWLFVVCALIYMVIAIGGYTRLTDSGLSIVAWDPISGVIPPTSDTEWLREFEHYQQYPEFKIVNQDMQLDDFKRIYWVEYAHRLAARLVALAFLLPFLYFLTRRYLSRALTLRLVLIFVLGGFQGLLGWYMVASGLVDNPAVSQYRLTAHLSLAVLLYSYVLWLGVGLASRRQPVDDPLVSYFRKTSILCIVFVALMQISGGFMAGTHAGFVINTYPDMNGELIPQMMGSLQPWWRNLFENVVTIQFVHRWVAVATVISVFLLWVGRLRTRQPQLCRMADMVLMAALLQFGFGISTLLSQVHLPIALAHQSGFILLLTVLVITLRLNWSPVSQRS
ncbi:MAG: heme A synthase [Gammaproteobacteria bacterium]|nr:heme A synthase [Gammaproteobacteria bacterium]